MNDEKKLNGFLKNLNKLNGTDYSYEKIRSKDPEIKAQIVARHDFIRTFQLFDPQIKELPDQLPYFKSLQKLVIRRTQIEEIPDGFLSKYVRGNTPRQVSFYVNKFKTISNATFDGMFFESLHLEGNAIKSLPEDLFDTWKVVNLTLGQNQLKTLPDTIFDPLTMLQVLTLDENQLSEIPPSLFMNQTSLTKLWLTGNQIEFLPEDLFFNTKKLQGLRLDKNPKLKHIPDEIFQNTPYLSSLTLPENVSSIPLSVGATRVKTIPHASYHPQDFRKRWMEYAAPKKIQPLLYQIEPEIPVGLARIAELAKIDKNIAEKAIEKLLGTQPDFGRYLPLEQVFIKKSQLKPKTVQELYPSTRAQSRDSLQICTNCHDKL
ncbi:MAG: leucine-rich repeat domain-containing protein [Candidatus Kariarchaeaceae archaeon]|jgi:Leucine-rich repeat (LRR) protein